MNKEELIKMIETLNFEEVRCMTLSYYKEKPSKYNYGSEDINPKTICIGTDLERLIHENAEYSRQRHNELYREIEKIKQKTNKEIE